MREFYLTDEKPKVLKDKEIIRKVHEHNLLRQVRVSIDKTLAVYSEIDVTERAKEQLVNHFARAIQPKMNYVTYDRVETNEIVIEGNLITMTQKELFNLLTDLGIKIEVTK